MGILFRNLKENILTKNGFKYEHRNVNGTLFNCYQKEIFLSDPYWAWVAVNIKTSKVVIYIELEAGNKVADYNFTLISKFEVYEEAFFNELDEKVTSYTKKYTKEQEEEQEERLCVYSVNLTMNDIICAEKAYEKGNYCMSYIDPMRFKIVKTYLSYFSNEPQNTQEILDKELVKSIIEKDDYLKMISNAETEIPKSFNEVCTFIGSIE